MELFKLVGKIAVDSSEANTKINEVSQNQCLAILLQSAASSIF